MPVFAANAVRVRVPAKVNLHLGVGPRRADGFHELCTVFQAVSIFDEIVAYPGPGLSMTVLGAQLPTNQDNLAWQAAELLAAHAQLPPDVALEVRKAIPVAAGMAGGSADAAATLLACATLWHTDVPKATMAELAAQLGSDVAFPLSGGTALGTGRGEQLTPVLTTGEFHWAFALAEAGLSTAVAYGELDRMRDDGLAPPPIGRPDAQLDALRAGDCERLASTLANDLQPAAISLRPQLRDVLDAGISFGALAGMVCGSGPTCAFLCRDAVSAASVRAQLDASGLCRGAQTATGPAHGAQLVT